MKLHETDIRVRSSKKTQVSSHSVLFMLTLLLSIGLRPSAGGQQVSTSTSVANAPLSVEQVVANLVAMNRERAQALHAYHGSRIYRVEYHGFPGTRSAELLVDVKYQSPGTKEFTILSSTGSKMIIDKVFEKLMQAETEALAAKAQRRAALNSDNYDFTLAGYETTPSGSAYLLIVEPRTTNKFLYRGRIWVDAKDFAVTRLEAEPAKNPSFWTRNSEIEEVYMKVNDFWLPARNHSVTAIRLGGRAELTIQYKNYQITNADPIGGLPTLETRSVDAGGAQP
ncbi:outer membrane lipoprotein-sorting protein [Silvibacterium bohemicum]|uniref:Outer membrane lipoprotein-sorting protein n=1 Tax=Silvibacterium bohemicum TaxID=1577686 RepID=A0A841JZB1_9BACT|nr:hypothetical protein [Silvibacterium bohemicum]MBB6143768.1 outer membrane lipoprotein-sorting protein [Silvibacterium bohemicum]